MKIYSRESKEYPFVPYLLRPNPDQFTWITRLGYVLFHGAGIMERYVTTMYRLIELHICAWG